MMDDSKFVVKNYKVGDVLFNEGDFGDKAYVLREGAVEVSIKSAGKNISLAVLEPPTVFGEMALLLKNQRRTATATVKKRSEIVEIDKDAFVSILASTDQVVNVIMSATVERLQKTTARLAGSPDVFMATADILGLVAMHATDEVEFFPLVKTVSQALRVEAGSVEDAIEKMGALRLVEVIQGKGGRKALKLKHASAFADTAKKLYIDSDK